MNETLESTSVLAERIRVLEAENERLKALLEYFVPKAGDPSQPEMPVNPDGSLPDFNLWRVKGLDTHEFNGVEYQVRFAPDPVEGDGYCSSADRLLWVRWNVKGVWLMEVCIHEGIHASLPDLPEEVVSKIAGDVARFAYRVILFKEFPHSKVSVGAPIPSVASVMEANMELSQRGRELDIVARLAYRQRVVSLLRHASCKSYLEATGWRRAERGRWISPYNKTVHVKDEAMHYERERARRALDDALEGVGFKMSIPHLSDLSPSMIDVLVSECGSEHEPAANQQSGKEPKAG